MLGVPYAFVKSGWLLGMIMMGITTLLTIICFMWIIEVCKQNFFAIFLKMVTNSQVISRAEAVEVDKAEKDNSYQPRSVTINEDTESLLHQRDG